MTERRSGDRIVITGYSGGSHFPRTQAETQFRLELDGSSAEGPFHVEGSVYGRDLRLRGPGTVVGSLLGRGDVTLDSGPAGGVLRLLGGAHASGNIGCVARGGRLPQSLAGRLDAAALVVRGDLVADHVALENAVIFGSVRARQVKLVQCIVFGMVLAEEQALFAATTLLAYRAPKVVFAGPCNVLFASGVSDEPPTFSPLQDGPEQIWPAEVTLYPVLRALGRGTVTHRPWETGEQGRGLACLHPADWVRVDTVRTERKVRDGKVTEHPVPGQLFVLSLASRALNLEALVPHLQHVTWMLSSALEFEHYAPADQANVRLRWERECTADELRLLQLVTTQPDPRAATAARTASGPTASVAALAPPRPLPTRTATPFAGVRPPGNG